MTTPTPPRTTTATSSEPDDAHHVADNDILRAALMTAAWATHEVMLQPDDLAMARNEGHPLQIVRLPDGRILVTAAHAPTCPLITSSGQSTCDDVNCDL